MFGQKLKGGANCVGWMAEKLSGGRLFHNGFEGFCDFLAGTCQAIELSALIGKFLGHGLELPVIPADFS